MSEFKRVQDIISELRSKLSTVLYSLNLELSIVRLLFLKYAVDNYVGANSVKNMQLCARAQKMFAMRDIENGIEIIIPVLRYIDDAYGLTNVLSSYENIDEYARELFGEDKNRQRKNIVIDDFKTVMDILGTLDLEEKDKGNTLGRVLVDTLVNNITMNSNRNSFSRDYTTRQSLSKLAGRILNVKSDEVFCDFVSGIGLSTIEITKDRLPKIINAEIYNAAVAISAMLYIMYGYKDFEIYSVDSLARQNPRISGDKIFVDGPIAAKLQRTNDNEYSDSSLATINRVLHGYMSRNQEALAVITLPSSPLFATKKQAVELRKEIISKDMLKAVVALPPMWRGTGVGTNLLVISRREQDEVVFINASNDSVSSKDRNSARDESLLPEDKIDLIVDTILNKETVVGFSCVVSKEEIENKEYNLLPASYVQVYKEEDNTTLEEIDEQLAILYKQLLG